MALERLKAAGGYTMAAAALVIVFVAFAGNDALSNLLARSTGVTVSPWYSGGEVVETIDHGTYRTLIHRPVFDGLFSDRSGGFIQIDWRGEPPWPQQLQDSVDYDRDGSPDLIVNLDTGTLKANVSTQDRSVRGIEETYRLQNGFAVRIALHKHPGKETPR